MRKKGILKALFLSTMEISAFTFGGGFVIVPLMKRKFSDELKWIGEPEIMDLVAIAQSSPGAIAVNASVIIGYRIAGIKGALVSALGTIIPPFLIISILSLIYGAVRDNACVSMAMGTLLASVAAVVFDVVIEMVWNIVKLRKAIPILIFLIAFAMNRILKINIILIILFSGSMGVVQMLMEKGKGK